MPVRAPTTNTAGGWVRDRLRFLAGVFSIDVLAYAVMSNHLHVVLQVDAARAERWAAEEVVARYGKLFRGAPGLFEACPSAQQQAELVALWRGRLMDVSWLMRTLNEYVARKANKEDGVKGRFWEGRFKSQPILDEQGLLTCMAYVDLNPVRAKLAKRLEDSDFTSIQERLFEAAKCKKQRKRRRAPAGLAPFADQVFAGQESGSAAVPQEFAGYVELLEWTGRALVPGKRGVLEAPALEGWRAWRPGASAAGAQRYWGSGLVCLAWEAGCG